MIKLVFCLNRLPGMTREQFQTYWRETHAPLVQRYAAVLEIARYVQSHTLPAGAVPLAQARGSSGQDFDGVAELWWDSMEAFAAGGRTAEGRAAGKALLEDEARFIDLPNSPIFLVEVMQFVG